MTAFKKTMTTVMATVLLIQSIIPVSLFASELPVVVRTSFDTRLATIKIAEKYDALVKSGTPSAWEAI